MCDFVTMTLLSGGVGAIGNIQAGKAQAQAAMYTAAVNEQNALFADRRAQDALLRGSEEESRVRQAGAAMSGRQTAQMAASGLDLGFGSPLDILTDTMTGTELDAARVRRNAALEAEDMDMQAWSYRSQAGLNRQEARSATTGALFGAAGSVLTAGASAAAYRARVGHN